MFCFVLVVHRFLFSNLFFIIFVLFFSRLLFIFYFWLSLVEMLPMPNPFVPEEHEPWCPYSLVQLNCMIAISLHFFKPFLLHGFFYGFFFVFCIFRWYSSTIISLLQRPKRYYYISYGRGRRQTRCCIYYDNNLVAHPCRQHHIECSFCKPQ